MFFLFPSLGKAVIVVLATVGSTFHAVGSSGCETNPNPKGVASVEVLPQFGQVTGASHDKISHIIAAKDALNGQSSFPPPLVVKTYKREGQSVVIDLVADSLPTVRWTNGGGTVRILSDGCRVILSRHK
jgi:hypothetical protein